MCAENATNKNFAFLYVYVSEKRSFVRYNGTLSFCFAIKSFFNAKYARDTQGTQRGFCIRLSPESFIPVAVIARCSIPAFVNV